MDHDAETTEIGILDRVARCECGEKITALENPGVPLCQCGRVLNYEPAFRLFSETLPPAWPA